MMYEEFKELTGKECSFEDFQKFEVMYMASSMDKCEFCEFVKGAVKAVKKEQHKPIQFRMTYDYRFYPAADEYCKILEVVKFDIARGKVIVKDTGKEKRWGDCHELKAITANEIIVRP